MYVCMLISRGRRPVLLYATVRKHHNMLSGTHTYTVIFCNVHTCHKCVNIWSVWLASCVQMILLFCRHGLNSTLKPAGAFFGINIWRRSCLSSLFHSHFRFHFYQFLFLLFLCFFLGFRSLFFPLCFSFFLNFRWLFCIFIAFRLPLGHANTDTNTNTGRRINANIQIFVHTRTYGHKYVCI